MVLALARVGAVVQHLLGAARLAAGDRGLIGVKLSLLVREHFKHTLDFDLGRVVLGPHGHEVVLRALVLVPVSTGVQPTHSSDVRGGFRVRDGKARESGEVVFVCLAVVAIVVFFPVDAEVMTRLADADV